MNFGEKLTNLIEESQKTRQQIADELGFKSKSNITYYERKESLPSSEILLIFCNYFGVSLDYFSKEALLGFHQHEGEYLVEEDKIPVMSDESISAIEVSYMVIPHSGITKGFAIIIDDDRLLKIGIPQGSTVILSKNFELTKKHKVLARVGEEQFFATYEKITDGYQMLIPVNDNITPIILEDNSSNKAEIVAIVKSIIVSEDA